MDFLLMIFNKWERFAILGLSVLIVFMWFGLKGRDYKIKNLNQEVNVSKSNYGLLIAQHQALAENVIIQNKAIDKMKIDEVKAKEDLAKFKIVSSKKYDALVEQYKDTTQDKQCEIIINRNRKYYEEDKGVGYEEN